MKLIKTLCFVSILAVIGSAHARSANPKLQADVTTLIQDVKADVANSNVTSEEIQSLQDAIDSIVTVAHKPNPTDVEALQALIKEIRTEGSATRAQQAELRADFWAVVNSAGIPASDITALKQAISNIYYSSNFTQAERVQLVADVEAILSDLPSKS